MRLCCKNHNDQEEIQQNSKPIDKKLLLWAIVTSILVTSCLSHIYVEPFLTFEPEIITNNCNRSDTSNFKGVDTLNITLYHSFDPEAHTGGHHHSHHVPYHKHSADLVDRDDHNDHDDHDDHGYHNDHNDHIDNSRYEQDGTEKCEFKSHHHEDEEPFCCMMWLKMVFLSGFALSQFSIGSVIEKFGTWSTLRFCIKAVIISGMIASNAGNVYIFASAWFLVAYMSSSTFLVVFCKFMEALDSTEVWEWRLIGGLAFQFNWSISRLLADLIVYLSNDWITVLFVITILITSSYFCLDAMIWVEENFTEKTVSMESITSNDSDIDEQGR